MKLFTLALTRLPNDSRGTGIENGWISFLVYDLGTSSRDRMPNEMLSINLYGTGQKYTLNCYSKQVRQLKL
jgi:hypothetical protein